MLVDNQDGIAGIEAALKRPRHRLRLGGELDALYEAATSADRIASMRRMLLLFFVLYASAVGLDAMLGIADVGLRIRFGVVAPLVLVCGLLLSSQRRVWIQGALGGLPMLVMTATIGLVGLHLQDLVAQRYLFAAGLFALHGNISYPQRWCWAVALGFGNAVLAWGVLVAMRGWGGCAGLADLAVFNSTLMVTTLYWSFKSEQGRRSAFLYDALTKLRAETLKQANSALEKLSLTDDLTALPNRRAFDREFEGAWLHMQKTGQALGLLLIDVDHFKAFNDNAGHLAGDACLRRVADVIRGALGRDAAFAARFGGEEFAVILPNCDPAMTQQIGERIRQAVLDCGQINPGRTPPAALSVSVGFVSTRNGAMDTIAMVRAADGGLYRAKGLGRNCVAADGGRATGTTA